MRIYALIIFVLLCSVYSCKKENVQQVIKKDQLLSVLRYGKDGESKGHFEVSYNADNTISQIQNFGVPIFAFGDTEIRMVTYEGGKIKRTDHLDAEGIPIGRSQEFIYENDKLIEKHDLRADGSISQKWVYSYEDDQITKSEYFFYSLNPNVISGLYATSYYEYDNQGNIIKHIYDHEVAATSETVFIRDDKRSPFENLNLILYTEYITEVNNVLNRQVFNSFGVLSSEEASIYAYDFNDYPIIRIQDDHFYTYEYIDR